MKRQFVENICPQDAIDDVFRVANKRLRPNRNGNLYLLVELTDRSGSIDALMWNAGEKQYRSFETGQFVRVEGTSQLHQGNKQIIATRITPVANDDVNEDDFVAQTHLDIGNLLERLNATLRGLSNPDVRAIAEAFLDDEAFVEKLARSPAGVKNHHAYRGGLLEHIVQLMEVAKSVAPCYPELDRDLLLMGVFLHDLGKVDELACDQSMEYTDIGQLIGHLVIGVSLLDEKVRQVEAARGAALPEETVLRLKHMIVSHHGQYEFGSPKLPMTLEAMALHLLDNLDAKIHSFRQLMDDDPNADSPWTNYQPALARKLFKSVGPGADAEGTGASG